jgi:hypothetical protein
VAPSVPMMLRGVAGGAFWGQRFRRKLLKRWEIKK